MRNYDLVMFDMDGTVMETLQDITNAVNYVLDKHGMPNRTMAEVRALVGNGAKKLIEDCVPEGTDAAKTDTVLGDFKVYYAANASVLSQAYEGIPELLQTLRAAGVKLACVSNKPQIALEKLCAEYFPGLFDAVLGGDRTDIPRKPAPDGVLAVMEQFGVARERALYVGDSDVDVLTSINAGIDGAYFLWGFRDEECLRSAGATVLLNSAKELEEMILA